MQELKRAYIIHGWGADPNSNWQPWLKKELERNNFKVEVPAMPNTDAPEMESWVEKLIETVGKTDEDTYFIGHSIGCQTILRYFEDLKSKSKVGGAVFVAGWFTLNLETEEEKKIAKPWFDNKINFDKVKKNCNKMIAIFSDNDPFVDLEENKLAFEKLGAEIVVEKNKGHFDDESKTTKLPSVLKAVLKLSVK